MTDLRETLQRTSKHIKLESKSDDGTWIERTFANEPAAQEYEVQMRKAGVETRRGE